VSWFTNEFMQQQTFLNDLPAADRDFAVEVASYAVLKTDMRVSEMSGHFILPGVPRDPVSYKMCAFANLQRLASCIGCRN
jgi:hypothetical protein